MRQKEIHSQSKLVALADFEKNNKSKKKEIDMHVTISNQKKERAQGRCRSNIHN